jgi:outer membrane protein TolC
MRRSWLVVALLCLVAPGVRAQVLTLSEIESKAQRERSELVERRAAIERAQGELALANSKGAATLGARAEGGISPGGRLIRIPYDGDEYLVSGSRALGESGALVPTTRYAAMLSGKLTILDFGRSALGVRAAEAALGAEKASLLQAKVELVRAARAAYLDWLEAHQVWQLAMSDAEVTRQRSLNVRALIGDGARPATDASLSSYDEQLAGLRQNRAARAAAGALQLLGAAVQSELPKDAAPDLKVLEAPSAPPPAAEATQDSPRDARLGALELQRNAALSAARAADRGASPVLDAAAEVGVQGQNERLFPVYKAGVTLSVPLWDGGVGSAQAAIHRAEARGLEARLQASERRLRAEQAAARARLQAAAQELGLSQELLKTAELVLTQAEEHYKSGNDTLERVLNAQRGLVQARREVLSAQLETARARLELTPIQVEP